MWPNSSSLPVWLRVGVAAQLAWLPCLPANLAALHWYQPAGEQAQAPSCKALTIHSRVLLLRHAHTPGRALAKPQLLQAGREPSSCA